MCSAFDHLPDGPSATALFLDPNLMDLGLWEFQGLVMHLRVHVWPGAGGSSLQSRNPDANTIGQNPQPSLSPGTHSAFHSAHRPFSPLCFFRDTLSGELVHGPGHQPVL